MRRLLKRDKSRKIFLCKNRAYNSKRFVNYSSIMFVTVIKIECLKGVLLINDMWKQLLEEVDDCSR